MLVFQRLKQFYSAVTARVSARDRAVVARVLPWYEQVLHTRMPRYDQRHCLDVYYTLLKAGVADVFVLRAALFHDTGKVDAQGRPISLWLYGGLVIFKRLWPHTYALLAASPRTWRRWFYTYAHHGPLGAQLALSAGSPPEIVALLTHYHDDEPTGRAAILQWADQQH